MRSNLGRVDAVQPDTVLIPHRQGMRSNLCPASQLRSLRRLNPSSAGHAFEQSGDVHGPRKLGLNPSSAGHAFERSGLANILWRAWS